MPETWTLVFCDARRTPSPPHRGGEGGVRWGICRRCVAHLTRRPFGAATLSPLQGGEGRKRKEGLGHA